MDFLKTAKDTYDFIKHDPKVGVALLLLSIVIISDQVIFKTQKIPVDDYGVVVISAMFIVFYNLVSFVYDWREKATKDKKLKTDQSKRNTQEDAVRTILNNLNEAQFSLLTPLMFGQESVIKLNEFDPDVVELERGGILERSRNQLPGGVSYKLSAHAKDVVKSVWVEGKNAGLI